MLFCSKCGNQLVDGAKFCPKCGASNEAFSAPIPKPTPTPQLTERMKNAVVAVATAIFALISFMPLFSISIPLIGRSYSLPDLFSIYNQLNDYIYPAYSDVSLATYEGIILWVVVIITVWIAAIVASVVGVANAVCGKEVRGYGFALLSAFGVLCIATAFVVGSMLADAAGSYALSASSVIAPTAWLWTLTVGSFVGFVAYFAISPRR